LAEAGTRNGYLRYNAKSNGRGPYGLSKRNNKTSKQRCKHILLSNKTYKVMAKKKFFRCLNSLFEIPNSGAICGAAEPKAAKKKKPLNSNSNGEKKTRYFIVQEDFIENESVSVLGTVFD
jgi:hypothetical protein